MRVWAILFFFVIIYGWTTSNAAGNPDDGAYEIDYEEEVEEVEDSAPPKSAPPASKVKKIGGGPAVQGSRAKNRFAPILKSETRSVYKKDGKSLDVDTD